MSEQPPMNRGRFSWVNWLDRLAGAALAAMLALTTADVIGRYLFARPVPGVIELIQYAMVIVIFSALPMVTLKGHHISVGLLDGRLGGVARRLQKTLIGTVSAVVLGTLSWTLFEIAGLMREQGDVIGFLRLPTFVAAYLMSALSLGTAFVCAARALGALVGRPCGADAH